MCPAEEFRSTIANLLAGRDVLNAELLRKSRAARQARAYSVQGLYLVAVRSFETFLEDQVLALASGKVRWASRKDQKGVRLRWERRLKEERLDMLKNIIRGRRDYADFLPYERTMELSELLFKGGRPFTELPKSDRDFIVRCHRVRNYIAHESDYAYGRFMKSYKEIKPSLRIQFPKPIHYLDDQIRSHVTFFEHDLAQLVSISRFLS
jgi:hypothetical protein